MRVPRGRLQEVLGVRAGRQPAASRCLWGLGVTDTEAVVPGRWAAKLPKVSRIANMAIELAEEADTNPCLL